MNITNEDKWMMIELLKSGLTVRAVADKFDDINEATLYAIWNKEKLKTQKPFDKTATYGEVCNDLSGMSGITGVTRYGLVTHVVMTLEEYKELVK